MVMEEKMKLAETAYNQAIGEIRTILDLKNGNKKDVKEYLDTLNHFESAIQGVLLYSAIENGVFSDAEKQFVTGITITGDVLPAINNTGRRKLYQKWVRIDWDNVCSNNMPQSLVKGVIAEAIRTEVQSFVFPLASIDSDISCRSYINAISECVKTIIVVLASPELQDPLNHLSGTKENMDYRMNVAELTLNTIDAGLKIFDESFRIYWKSNEPLD